MVLPQFMIKKSRKIFRHIIIQRPKETNLQYVCVSMCYGVVYINSISTPNGLFNATT